MINIDDWYGAYQVRAFDWTDGESIYFNVRYYNPGASLSNPAIDRSVLITDNEPGRRMVRNFTHSLAQTVATMSGLPEGLCRITVEHAPAGINEH